MNFEILSHTADLRIRVFGSTMKDLFCNAVVGMFQSIGPQATGCLQKNGLLMCDQLPIQRNVEITAKNCESLLVDFLSQALYLSDIYNEAYLDVVIHSLENRTIKATLQGIVVEAFQVVEIKAVTYHDLAIKKVGTRWQVDIIFDI